MIRDYEHIPQDVFFSCQTYEGGIGSSPGTEAHGGYTFCGLATMSILGEIEKLDLRRLKVRLDKT